MLGFTWEEAFSSQAELGYVGVRLGVGRQPRDSAPSLKSILLWHSGLFPGTERTKGLLRIHRPRAPISPGMSWKTVNKQWCVHRSWRWQGWNLALVPRDPAESPAASPAWPVSSVQTDALEPCRAPANVPLIQDSKN